MRLSAKCRYAVMAMAELGLMPANVSLSQIADKQNLPLTFLEQLFAILRRKGLVHSTRGPSGGFRLARASEDITVWDIIAAIDTPVRTTGCDPQAKESCNGYEQKCMTHDLWHNLEGHIAHYLKSVTLADVCRNHQHERRCA